MLDSFKRVLVGRPLATSEQEHQRISKTIALAVFSSDAISSTAYATQEILLVVAVGGSSLALGLSKLVPISIVVAVLLAIVVTSYRQTIFAYPSGGGSYVVSRENLGPSAAMVAGASLLVDYILTVAVSVCAGVRAITSIPALHSLTNQRVLICLAFIALITVANLRGIKESGRIFALPTYLYIFVLTGLVGWGLAHEFGLFGMHSFPTISFADVTKTFSPQQVAKLKDDLKLSAAGVGTLGLFRLMRGFSSGAVALTGVEAISNGVPAFQRNESRNAAITLVWMGVILGGLFLGVSVLAHHLHPIPLETGESVFSQMGRTVYGQGVLYYVLQGATAAILTLAANTAYADFPRLSSIIARDGYLPRQLANRGDRLVFSNGVLVLAVAASVLVVIFGGNESKLIPLYAVGVFTSFTLSQTGMVRHHQKEREPGWRRNIVVNAVGAISTLIVTLIIATSKFTGGAWVSILVVLVVIALFRAIHGHYARVAESLKVDIDFKPRRMNHTVVVLVGTVHRGVLEALAYARSLQPNRLLAVTVVSDEEEQERIERQWSERKIDVPLEIVHSPYRELSRPILRFIDELDARYENDIITVVVPEFVVGSWWGQLLHNQSALMLKGRLLFRKGTVVTSVPYHLEKPS
ncbi:MAG TPA: APC family permease [Acidimicrobiia bacterium]|nr:APC family permease [Acidimicrobiia bacterium]